MKKEVLAVPGLFGSTWQLGGAVAVAGFAHAQLLHCCHSITTWVLLFVSLECYFSDPERCFNQQTVQSRHRHD